MEELCDNCLRKEKCEAPIGDAVFNYNMKVVECKKYKSKAAKLSIKDSGERTEFPSGAVRDMHIGKGRYDLLPWNAIHELAIHCENGAIKYGERNCEKGIPLHSLLDSATRHLSCYLRGQNEENHLRAALWNIAMALEMEANLPEMQDIPIRKVQK